MARYFLAITIPDLIKDRLVAAQPRESQGMRLIGRDEFHLTLHFLGELAQDRFVAACEILSRMRLPAFTIAIEGLGLFPPEGTPEVLWDSLNDYLMANTGFVAPPMTVDRIALFSSEFQGGLPRYRPEAVFQISGSTSPS